MKIVVRGETEVRVSAGGRDLEILEERGGHFDPLAMMAASLAGCTLAVLHSWAEATGLHTRRLVVIARWRYGESPHRVDAYELEIDWPSLPLERRERARRVAQKCAVHATLEHPPTLEIAFGG